MTKTVRMFALSSISAALLAVSSPAMAHDSSPFVAERAAASDLIASRPSRDQEIFVLKRGEATTEQATDEHGRSFTITRPGALEDPMVARLNWALATMLDRITNPGRDLMSGSAEGNEDQDRNIDRMNNPGPQRDDREGADNRDNDGSNNGAGGHEDRGRFTDNGHGRNPAPKPELRVMPVDWRSVDARSVLSNSGSGIGG